MPCDGDEVLDDDNDHDCVGELVVGDWDVAVEDELVCDCCVDVLARVANVLRVWHEVSLRPLVNVEEVLAGLTDELEETVLVPEDW